MLATVNPDKLDLRACFLPPSRQLLVLGAAQDAEDVLEYQACESG